MLKDRNCGELRSEHAGQLVTLAGWVNRRRDLGGLVFIDLRDRDGITQVVANPEISAEAFRLANQSRPEFVLQIRGIVRERPEGMQNPEMPTGGVEVVAQEIKVLNSAKTPPFLINREEEEAESLRLKYRYLDLRRSRMQRNMLIRHRAVKFIRDFLDERRLYRNRNAHLVQEHARRRTGLSGAQPGPSWQILRAAPEPAAAQAAADGGRV